MASIQQSLNNLFAASLGAGFAITQSPAVKQFLEKKEATKTLEKAHGAIGQLEEKRKSGELTREEYNAAMTQAGQEAAELTKKVSTTPEEYAEGLSLQQRSLREVEKKPRSVKDIMATTPGMQLASDVVAREQAAQEAKQGVQNAVKERKALLDQLRAQGVNVDNPAVRIHGITDEKEET